MADEIKSSSGAQAEHEGKPGAQVEEHYPVVVEGAGVTAKIEGAHAKTVHNVSFSPRESAPSPAVDGVRIR